MNVSNYVILDFTKQDEIPRKLAKIIDLRYLSQRGMRSLSYLMVHTLPRIGMAIFRGL